MSDFYDQEKDTGSHDSEWNWKAAHAVGKRLTKITPTGVSKFSNNMGHGAECTECSAGMLQDQETELGRDSHFKESMKMHNDNLGSND
jgi:hypothetical protein